ncbi:cytochrome b N-terminal domain-containing protein [Desulfitobacterium hafniense]|uniref:cytochrome b N-terminal domain-containing protein n=1 Tax=Desulfitobacterium hafniense TaxID=49338 RepID=UPI001AD8087B|nr:cytochrome b N-terminal domain-containing protein [Desulfitobacterium hafniense]
MSWCKRRLFSVALEPKEVEVKDMLKEIAEHPVPKHARNFIFCFGGIAFLLFLVQVVTGIVLAFYYSPTMEGAYQSVMFINNEVFMGKALRSVHNIAANLMLIMVVLHFLRVVFTGAYKPPRQFNWVIGVLLLLLVIMFCFTGYLLPMDQVGYWAAIIGTKILGSIPIVGDQLLLLGQAGSKVTDYTLIRFFIIHIVILPVITIGFLIAHFLMIRKQGISGPL